MCIRDSIGIDAKPRRWSLDFVRTPYFSDYLDADDWRDLWQPAWRVFVEVSKARKIPKNRVPYFETNSADASWTPKDYHGTRKTARAVVIADFEKRADLG